MTSKENNRTMSRTLLKRAVAAATALGLVGAASLALATTAGAAEAGGLTPSIPGNANPIVINGTTEAPAGDIWVTAAEPIQAGETITLQVAQPAGPACTADVNENLWFDTTPTVTFPGGGGRLEVSLGRTGGCNVDNQVILKHAGSSDVPAGVVKVSGITYAVGKNVSIGKVRLGLSGTTPTAALSNANVARVDRVAGADRYATAAALHGVCTSAANRVPRVVVVNGTNFPDALAASYTGLPILLVQPDAVPAATSAALRNLGVREVVVIGGTQAVTSGVSNAINGISVGDCGATDLGVGKIKVVSRLGGATRYDTARIVATSAQGGAAGTFSRGLNPGTCDAVRTAILVSGENFPDALAAGALSAGGSKAGGCGAGRIPLLLTPGNKLSPEAVEALHNRAIEQVIIVGGTQAVSGQVFTEVAELDIIDNVERIAGPTRQDTAAEVADRLVHPGLGNYGGSAIVASGLTFPDALVAGPVAGQIGAPILLSRTSSDLGPVAAAWITDIITVNHVVLLGGTNALADTVLTSVRTALTDRN